MVLGHEDRDDLDKLKKLNQRRSAGRRRNAVEPEPHAKARRRPEPRPTTTTSASSRAWPWPLLVICLASILTARWYCSYSCDSYPEPVTAFTPYRLNVTIFNDFSVAIREADHQELAENAKPLKPVQGNFDIAMKQVEERVGRLGNMVVDDVIYNIATLHANHSLTTEEATECSRGLRTMSEYAAALANRVHASQQLLEQILDLVHANQQIAAARWAELDDLSTTRNEAMPIHEWRNQVRRFDEKLSVVASTTAGEQKDLMVFAAAMDSFAGDLADIAESLGAGSNATSHHMQDQIRSLIARHSTTELQKRTYTDYFNDLNREGRRSCRLCFHIGL